MVENPPLPLSEPMRVDPGSRVAGYRIEGQIGQGGMAVVFRAHDERLDRTVALKILSSALAADEAFRQRFIRESRAAAAVDHRHIVPIYEAGEADGLLFIAMRFIDGGDVGTLARSDIGLSIGRVTEIISQAASALDAAHARGLVHRDVKPANMLLEAGSAANDQSDHVYLTDFGLSKATLEASALTATGMFLGTVNYIAPEQIEGRLVDGRIDQYSLACTAFELLSGAPLFDFTEFFKVLYAHVTTPPPALTDRRPDFPTTVNAVFARALAKAPADRFASCGDFAAELREALAAVSGGRAGPGPTGIALGVMADSPIELPEARIDSATVIRSVPVLSAPGAQLEGGIVSGEYAQYTPGQPSEAVPWPDGDSGIWRAALASNRTMNIPLRASFRYIHEPSRMDQNAIPSLGNDRLIAELKDRIKYSRGGSFLITGFRGVGKSTLVLRTLDQIAEESGQDDLIVPVLLSVARSTSTERLLFAVVRRVFETLCDTGAFGRLSPATRQALLVAYMRTSLSFKETQSDTRDLAAGMSLGPGSGKGLKALLSAIAPSVSISSDRSHSLATEAAFLAYSETDAEYDLQRIVSLVGQQPDATVSRLRGWRRWWYHKQRVDPKVHLIIILDEIDKLTVNASGLAAVEDLLSGIKNVFTMPGAHFLLVAGPDLHDRAVRDAARGNGIYESVFGWSMYVPCTWNAPDLLVQGLTAPNPGDSYLPPQALTRYLRFKSRGVPRRLLQELNRFVVWEDGIPHLRVSSGDLPRVNFYAHLEDVLSAYFEDGRQSQFFPVPIDEDRWRLGGYYVVDWVLASQGEPFSETDLLREGEDPDFDPLLRLSRRNVSRLLEHLTKCGILELVREMNAHATVYADIAESRAKVYRLAEDVRRRQRSLAVRHEYERAERDPSLNSPSEAREGRPMILDGRYELVDLLSQGGMASIYSGRDLATGREVAVKLLRDALTADPLAVARVLREGEISKPLDHPQIVHTYDVLVGNGHGPALVIELLRGPNLQDAITSDAPMSPADTVAIGYALAGALIYLGDKQIARLGMKPGNIIITDRGPVISDLGIAVLLDADRDLTRAGQLIGTPAYMAPELLTGSDPDPRADQYALAAVLHYCLTGKNPREAQASPPMATGMRRYVDLSRLAVSAQFRDVLARALEPKPDDRYPRSADFREALKSTPEWQCLPEPAGITGHRPAQQ
jgi:serine/threonine protein kinase